MPVTVSYQRLDDGAYVLPTILDENGQAFLDQQGSIEDDQPKTQRQHIVAGPDL